MLEVESVESLVSRQQHVVRPRLHVIVLDGQRPWFRKHEADHRPTDFGHRNRRDEEPCQRKV